MSAARRTARAERIAALAVTALAATLLTPLAARAGLPAAPPAEARPAQTARPADAAAAIDLDTSRAVWTDRGDWFNAVHWNCADGNGFGRGLPPAADNRDKRPCAEPLLNTVRIGCPPVTGASAAYRDLLRIRLFNATPERQEQRVGTAAGTGYRLHPVQAAGADPVVKGASYAAGTGTFSVPGRTVAVFRRAG